MRRTLVGSLLVLAVLAACDGDDPPLPPIETAPTGPTAVPSPSATGPSPPTPIAEPTGSLADVRVGLERVASLEAPVAIAIRPGDPSLYVAEKTGRVVRLGDEGEPRVIVDLSGQVSLGSEQGLLGIAFAPDGGHLYANYTDTNGDTHLVAFEVRADGGVDPTARELLLVGQPYSNHNGGALAFGPDGHLYVALGDGGAAADPADNAQSLETLLGKILRISPEPSGGRPYSVPSDNPFVGRDGARPEIWAYGLRNPWRISFDRSTGDLWIGDVGQSAFEEVDVAPAGSAGLNFGWDRFEGLHPFEGEADRRDTVFPVHEYPHDGAVCSVTGGYVYRGTAIPELRGAYVFGDYCVGRLEALRLVDGELAELVTLGPVVPALASFGEDADGELYALSLAGDVYRLVSAAS